MCVDCKREKQSTSSLIPAHSHRPRVVRDIVSVIPSARDSPAPFSQFRRHSPQAQARRLRSARCRSTRDCQVELLTISSRIEVIPGAKKAENNGESGNTVPPKIVAYSLSLPNEQPWTTTNRLNARDLRTATKIAVQKSLLDDQHELRCD